MTAAWIIFAVLALIWLFAVLHEFREHRRRERARRRLAQQKYPLLYRSDGTPNFQHAVHVHISSRDEES